jgi:pimeloyl-ACP methyl ester carboxylesterase
VSDPRAPQWFQTALALGPQRLSHDLDGVRLTYRAWGGRGLPLVVLVHGGSAHGGWWDHIGPLLAGRHRVLAPDLSGHGDSGQRSTYGLGPWTAELAALVERESEGDSPPPVLIGHSMGGWVALSLAATRPELVGELVVIDSPMRAREPGEPLPPMRTTLAVYPSRQDALEHFRLTPAQDHAALPFVMEHVAATSIREVEGGWSWKFDPAIAARRGESRPDLAHVSCPVTLLPAERGMLALEDAGRAAAVLGGAVTIAQIPDAGHHVMMDEPLALVTALRLVLARPGA